MNSDVGLGPRSHNLMEICASPLEDKTAARDQGRGRDLGATPDPMHIVTPELAKHPYGLACSGCL